MTRPKEVVLGRGELHLHEEHPDVRPLSAEVWRPGMLIQKFLNGISHCGERGTLIWRPDPPKPKKRRSHER